MFMVVRLLLCVLTSLTQLQTHCCCYSKESEQRGWLVCTHRLAPHTQTQSHFGAAELALKAFRYTLSHTHTLALMCSEEARTLKLVANCLLKLT